MKENIYKLLKFLNRNKIIAGVFVFALFFITTKNVYAGIIMSWIDQGIGGLLVDLSLVLISLSSFAFGLVFPIFLNLTGNILNSVPINTAWILVRDLVNMFFIFFLLFTSLAKLVGKEKTLKQGGASKQIVYILISAFLINFSKVICGVVVDIAQIVTLQFTNAFIDGLQNLGSIFGGDVVPKKTAIIGILFIVFALAFLATALTAMLYILIRAVSLGILSALSPLWFLWLSFPTKSASINQIKTKTVDSFFTAAIGGPILAFYLWIALMLINPGEGSFTNAVDQAGSGPNTKTFSTNDDSSAQGADITGAFIMKMVVATAVMLYAQKQAMEMSKSAGNVVSKGLMDGVVNKVGSIGMKPLDGLKQLGKNTLNTAGNLANNAGNFIGAKTGKASDLMMGGVKNGLNNFSKKEGNVLAGALRGGMELKNNLTKSSIDNAKYVSNRKAQEDARNKAIKEGNPEKIKEANNAISDRKKDYGKRVWSEVQAAGGVKDYVRGGVSKAVNSVTAIGLTGGAIVSSIATGGLFGAGLLAAGATFGAGTYENGKGDRAKDEKKRLEELKKKMENDPKFTKENIEHVDAKIKKQNSIITEDQERQKLSDYNKTRSKRGLKSLEDEKAKLLKNEQLTDKQKDRIKQIEALDGEDGIIKSKTANEIKKQEGALASATSAIDKANKKIDDARNRSAGITEKKEDSTSLKAFKEAFDDVSSSLIDSSTGKPKDGKSIHLEDMISVLKDKNGKERFSIAGNENDFLANLAFAIKNNTVGDKEKTILANKDIQTALTNYVNKKDKDFKENWNKILGNVEESELKWAKARIPNEENTEEDRQKVLAAIANNNGNVENNETAITAPSQKASELKEEIKQMEERIKTLKQTNRGGVNATEIVDLEQKKQEIESRVQNVSSATSDGSASASTKPGESNNVSMQTEEFARLRSTIEKTSSEFARQIVEAIASQNGNSSSDTTEQKAMNFDLAALGPVFSESLKSMNTDELNSIMHDLNKNIMDGDRGIPAVVTVLAQEKASREANEKQAETEAIRNSGSKNGFDNVNSHTGDRSTHDEF